MCYSSFRRKNKTNSFWKNINGLLSLRKTNKKMHCTTFSQVSFSKFFPQFDFVVLFRNIWHFNFGVKLKYFLEHFNFPNFRPEPWKRENFLPWSNIPASTTNITASTTIIYFHVYTDVYTVSKFRKMKE